MWSNLTLLSFTLHYWQVHGNTSSRFRLILGCTHLHLQVKNGYRKKAQAIETVLWSCWYARDVIALRENRYRHEVLWRSKHICGHSSLFYRYDAIFQIISLLSSWFATALQEYCRFDLSAGQTGSSYHFSSSFNSFLCLLVIFPSEKHKAVQRDILLQLERVQLHVLL